MLQPVLVRPLAGGTLRADRRRAPLARRPAAGLEPFPALVRQHDDAASLELALIENMAREDLNPVEEARACAALVEELGLTREEVGLRVGRSRVAVSNLIRLLDLPDEALGCSSAASSARATAGRCCSPTTTPTAAGWPARRVAGRGRCASSRPARARPRSPAARPRAPGAARRACIPTRQAARADRGRARRRAGRRRARDGPRRRLPRRAQLRVARGGARARPRLRPTAPPDARARRLRGATAPRAMAATTRLESPASAGD